MAAAAEAVERVREVVVVKEDAEGKARADAARKEVEEVGAFYVPCGQVDLSRSDKPDTAYRDQYE